MEREDHGSADGIFDWDAAFEAIVAPLRMPRHVQVARAVGAGLVVITVLAVTWLMLLQVVAAQARGLAQPMR